MAQPKSFHDLPVEIRLQIYEECFSTTPVHFPFGVRGTSITSLSPQSAQLLRTCKRISQEALETLYSRPTFHWEIDSDIEFFLNTFSKDALRCIRHISLPALVPIRGKMRFDFGNYATLLGRLENLKSISVWIPDIRLRGDTSLDSQNVEGPGPCEGVWEKFGRPNLIALLYSLDHEAQVRVKALSFRIIVDWAQRMLEEDSPTSAICRTCYFLHLDAKEKFGFRLEWVKWQEHSFKGANWDDKELAGEEGEERDGRGVGETVEVPLLVEL
ncbi:hypothetical protein EJ08DRAFT_653965 [Tothia fuscella]|uniref:DUF7730 domain-containing protein n=1 Tax=Tothia fuscella TaxID=1048955 RepID=A0A9P4NFW4_9PEZI|nr:hypothetical protein EJ08DRAFT_653965 [Tothia fuscella]